MSKSPLFAPMPGANHLEIKGIQIDIFPAGAGRIKRMIYPPGTRWSTHIKHMVSTELCMHAHVGFLAHGRMQFRFSDGCTLDFCAPQVLVVEPGHEGWVVGDEPAVLIEFDFEKDTVQRFGLPEMHRHG
jgi:hypothetical protein